MEMIKAIIFDLGGALVPEKSSEIKERLAEYLGITSAEFLSLLEVYQSKASRGKMRLIEVYSKILKNIKSDIKAEELLQKHIEIYKETSTQRDEKIIRLINQLKTKYQVYALTNTEIETAEFNKGKGLFEPFKKVYFSTEMGLMKPQPEIYQKVLEELKLDAQEVIFIDDNKEYSEVAEKLGMHNIHYTSYESLLDSLKGLGVRF